MNDDTRRAPLPFRLELGTGRDGTLETLWAMRAIVEDAQRSSIVKRWAASMEGRSPRDTLMRVYTAVRRGVAFRPDPPEVEEINLPDEILAAMEAGKAIAIDCDESAVLIAAALKALGHPTAFVVVGRRPESVGGRFEHVFTAAKASGDEWLCVDAQEGLSPHKPLVLSNWPMRLLFPLEVPVRDMIRAGLA